MKLKVIHDLHENEWRRFVENHPKGNVFHTPEMFQVFRRTKGYEPELWACTDTNRILALLPIVQITLKDGFLKYLTTRSVAFGSILCMPDSEGHKALRLLLQTYNDEKKDLSLFTELRNLSDMSAIQSILNQCGFTYEDHLNYLIDLKPSSKDVLNNVGRRTRKHIRRGLRQNEVIVEEITEREQIGAWYDLLKKTYRNARVPLVDRSLFEAAFDILSPKKMARFILARVGRVPVANSVELYFKGTVYGWFGGLNRAFGSYMPNEIMTWHILQHGAESGYHQYDFGGAGSPEHEYGVRNFKAKFGGKLVSYGRNTCIHHPRILKLSSVGYRFFRKLININHD